MGWLLLLAPVALLVALLAVPVEIAFAAGAGESSGARLAWLFGLVRFPLRGAPAKPARPARRRKRSRVRAFRLVRSRGFLSGLARHGRRLARSLHLRLRARATIGLADPADTGKLYGYLTAARFACPLLAYRWLELEPEFREPALHGSANGYVRFVPLRVIAETVAFVVSWPTIRAIHVGARRVR